MKKMHKDEPIDPNRVWVFRKVIPGWYIAKGIWDDAYAKHLESMGYKVSKSIKNPATVEAAS